MPTQIIAVTGGKGGVGKSTTTVNLGVSLRMDGYTVALVDADVEMPNLVELLGIDAEQTIHDVLSGTADPEDALVEIAPQFAVVPGDSSLAGYGSIEPERLQDAVDALAESYQYVILDTGAGLSYDDLIPIGLADEIILVTSPDSAAVENAKRTQSFVHRLNREISGLVVTKADETVDGSIADEFETTLLAMVPDDDEVRKSTASGQPLELMAPDSSAAAAYRQLEANITDGALPPKRSVSSSSKSEEPAESAEEDGTPEEEPSGDPTPEPASNELDEGPRGGLISRLVRLVS